MSFVVFCTIKKFVEVHGETFELASSKPDLVLSLFSMIYQEKAIFPILLFLLYSEGGGFFHRQKQLVQQLLRRAVGGKVQPVEAGVGSNRKERKEKQNKVIKVGFKSCVVKYTI